MVRRIAEKNMVHDHCGNVLFVLLDARDIKDCSKWDIAGAMLASTDAPAPADTAKATLSESGCCRMPGLYLHEYVYK